jgi:hypothetical protein
VLGLPRAAWIDIQMLARSEDAAPATVGVPAAGGHEGSMSTGMSRARQHAAEESVAVSLLWPNGAPGASRDAQPLPADAAADLQLPEVIRVLAAGEGRPARRDHRERLVRQTLTALCTDPAVIAYRQETVAELLDNLALREQVIRLLPDLEALAETGSSGRFQALDDGAAQQIARQLGDLELFVEVARQLERALD